MFKIKLPKWFIILSASIVPGSGHVLINRPIRGLIYVFWVLSMGYITFMFTSVEIPFAYRISGGFAVWMASVIELVMSKNLNLKKLR